MMFFKNEIRKILRFPLFWVMIAVCAGLNLFVIADSMSYERVGIQAVNDYVRTGNVPSYDVYNVCVNYDEVKESAYDQYYKDFDILAFKADIEKMFVTQSSAAAQKLIDRNYQKAAARVDEIRQDGEAYDHYYPGVTFSLHEMLYGDLFTLLLFELAVTACFMTAYLMKYEEFHDTHQNVYATKIGRGIVFSKAAASVAASALAAVIVITASVTCFLVILPQSWTFLQSSVGGDGDRRQKHGALSLYHLDAHESARLPAARLCGDGRLHRDGFAGDIRAVLRLQKRLRQRRADGDAVLCPFRGGGGVSRQQSVRICADVHAHSGYAERIGLVYGICVYPLRLLSRL